MSATVIIDTESCKGEYPMFDVHSLDEKGAVLVGPLFLEVGETLKIRLDQSKQNLELEARVHSVAREEESMTVHFLKPEPKLAALLGKKA